MDRLPYFPEQAIEMLKPFDTIVIAGAKKPVAFFGYPDFPSQLIPEGINTAILAEPTDDVPAALEALASEIGAPVSVAAPSRISRPRTSCRKAQRDDRGRRDCGGDARGRDRDGRGCHHRAAVPGGVGGGAAAYISFADGRRDRARDAVRNRRSGRVSRQARDRFSGRRQRRCTRCRRCGRRRGNRSTSRRCCATTTATGFLQVELARAGVTEPGRKARSLTSLSNPNIEWTSLARGLGVPAVRVETAEALMRELERSFATPGPTLIEMIL